MRDFGKEQLEVSRPEWSALDTLNFCLNKLYADKQHNVSDSVCTGMSYEELIGCLLLARDECILKRKDV